MVTSAGLTASLASMHPSSTTGPLLLSSSFHQSGATSSAKCLRVRLPQVLKDARFACLFLGVEDCMPGSSKFDISEGSRKPNRLHHWSLYCSFTLLSQFDQCHLQKPNVYVQHTRCQHIGSSSSRMALCSRHFRRPESRAHITSRKIHTCSTWTAHLRGGQQMTPRASPHAATSTTCSSTFLRMSGCVYGHHVVLHMVAIYTFATASVASGGARCLGA